MEEYEPLSAASGTASVEYTKSSLEMHNFSTEISSNVVYFQVLKLESCLFIWIGSGTNPTFSDLSMAINTRYSSSPLATRLMGEHTDMVSSNLASRLTKKLGKQVYVSYNMASDILTLQKIEKRLQEEMKIHPEKFED